MDEGKKSKSSGDAEEQVGPYQLHEQVPQDEYSRGELYRATHEESGARALVLKPAEDKKGSVRLCDWSVRINSSAAPGYVAMEVEHFPMSVAPDNQSVESLVCTFEEVREAVGHMEHALNTPTAPRRGWRLGLALAGAVVVGALLFARVHLAPVSQPSSDSEPVASAASVPTRHDVPAQAETPDTPYSAWLGNTTSQEEPVLARPLPREPFKGQKRPPCTPRVEVELIGACWGPHKLTAPCPDELFEHQGECYAPIFSAKPPPQSLGQ
jgi:hypothetical protein